jgi:dipeptide/tripeptide permease
MLLIFVYSCFWILYFQNFGSVLWYLRDFIDPAPVSAGITGALRAIGIEHDFVFDAQHVIVTNALTIVLLQIVVSRIVKNIKPLPTMCAGVLIGSMGFLSLSSSQNAWVFVIGIVVFTLGEMTAHPKYISYIGLIAPQDKKAVYMGYAFLYGVVGSLFGSNLGGEMYHAILAPLKGHAGVAGTLRDFWLVFAGLGVLTMGGLILYSRLFGADTDATRRRARVVMFFIYGLLLAGSAAMLLLVFRAGGAIPVKTAIQSGIMALIGVGGILALRRRASPA